MQKRNSACSIIHVSYDCIATNQGEADGNTTNAVFIYDEDD